MRAEARVTRLQRFRAWAAVFALFLAIVVAFQIAEGAYRAELAGFPDEPSHYVTGLMVRDYLVNGLGQNPLRYAQIYYKHYPKVGLGHWPPLFYVVQAGWMLIGSTSRSSMMLLMAVLTALLATVLVRFASTLVPFAEAFAAGCVMLSLPLIRELSGEVMSEMLVSLTVLLAATQLGDFLDSGAVRKAVWFGVFAALAILTKGTGLVLGLAPGLAILLGWRWHLLKHRAFWVPATIAVLVCVPWYLMAPDALHESVAAYGGLRKDPRVVQAVLGFWLEAIGPYLACFALVGIVREFARLTRREPGNGRWIVASALLLSMGIFQSLVAAAWGVRIVSIVVPVLLMFAISGIQWTASLPVLIKLPRDRVSACILAAVSVGTVAWASHHVLPKPRYGYRELVSMLQSRPEWGRQTMMIVSDSSGEGALVSEVAMNEKRPGHTIIRGSKFLESEDWMGYRYRMLYTTPEEFAAAAAQAGITLVVVDMSAAVKSGERPELYRLVREAVERPSGRWQAVFPGAIHPSSGPGRSFLVYEVR